MCWTGEAVTLLPIGSRRKRRPHRRERQHKILQTQPGATALGSIFASLLVSDVGRAHCPLSTCNSSNAFTASVVP